MLCKCSEHVLKALGLCSNIDANIAPNVLWKASKGASNLLPHCPGHAMA